MPCTGVAMAGDAVATAEAVLDLMRSGRFADIDDLRPRRCGAQSDCCRAAATAATLSSESRMSDMFSKLVLCR